MSTYNKPGNSYGSAAVMTLGIDPEEMEIILHNLSATHGTKIV